MRILRLNEQTEVGYLLRNLEWVLRLDPVPAGEDAVYYIRHIRDIYQGEPIVNQDNGNREASES